MLNASATYRIAAGPVDFDVYVKGTNLTDEEARLHTSFLKDIAPLAGRGVLARRPDDVLSFPYVSSRAAQTARTSHSGLGSHERPTTIFATPIFVDRESVVRVRQYATVRSLAVCAARDDS